MSHFRDRFVFKPEHAFCVGIEREGFLTRNDSIYPGARDVLKILGEPEKFGYELSACQLEDRIGPCTLASVQENLETNRVRIEQVLEALGLKMKYVDVAPADMPLDVYPDPTGRYQEIVKQIPLEVLRAACRVAAIHIHIGMPDHDTALRIYNNVIRHTDHLIHLGDLSGGERLRIYKIMASHTDPVPYATWTEYEKHAVVHGFVNDPRKCWHFIRISIHGTIEFRMFGATNNLETICSWAQECHDLCTNAVHATC